MTNESQRVVDTLNSLLRGEISAVETYRQALTKLNHSGARPELEDCHRSHEHRMATLREHILRRDDIAGIDSREIGAVDIGNRNHPHSQSDAGPGGLRATAVGGSRSGARTHSPSAVGRT